MTRLIDITGQRFELLTVLAREGRDTTGKTTWRCRCDCGGETVATGLNLKSGTTRSCGCLKDQPQYRDLTGMRTGRLVVLGYADTIKGVARWRCKCDCGNETLVRAAKLTMGHTRSCGCLKRAPKPKSVPGCRTLWRKTITQIHNECAKCGSKDELHAHHIIPVKVAPRLRYDLTNGISLCHSCHRALHSQFPLGETGARELGAFLGLPDEITEVIEILVGLSSHDWFERLTAARHGIDRATTALSPDHPE